MHSSLCLLPLVVWLMGCNAAQAQWPEDLTWKNRILLVFSDGEHIGLTKEQGLLIDADKAGFEERDLVGYYVFGHRIISPQGEHAYASKAQALRQRYADAKLGGFQVVLVGKDGGVKNRWTAPVGMAELFANIDAMPMRRREMRSKKQNE